MSRHVVDRLPELLLGELNHVEREELEAHLAACELCMGEIGAESDALAAIVLGLEPIEPLPGVRARLLDAVAPSRGRYARFVQRVSRLLDLAAEEVQQMLDSLELPATWEPGPYENTELVHLVTGPAVAGAHAGFVRVQGGTRFPRHEHLGEERVLVLQGHCRDESGAISAPGDEVVMAPHTAHYFDVLDGPDFVYLVVLEGGVKFETPPSAPVRGVPDSAA